MPKISENRLTIEDRTKIDEKARSEADFSRFWLDFGTPGGRQERQESQKNGKKTKPKKAQKTNAKKSS